MKPFYGLSLAVCVLCSAGCQASGLPTAPRAAMQSAARPQAPQRLTDNQVRHLLDISGGQATLWGVQFTMSQDYYYWYDGWNFFVIYDKFTPVMTTSGPGSFIKASYDRYIYTVPADQALVLNNVDGNGAININGFDVPVTPTQNNVQRSLYYLFGPGEQVVFNFKPIVTGTSSAQGFSWGQHVYTSYAQVKASGFTAGAAYLAGGVGIGSK